jgi:hypothetical protein
MQTLKLSPVQKKHLTLMLNMELRTTLPESECGKALNDMFRQLTGRDHEKHPIVWPSNEVEKMNTPAQTQPSEPSEF